MQGSRPVAPPLTDLPVEELTLLELEDAPSAQAAPAAGVDPSSPEKPVQQPMDLEPPELLDPEAILLGQVPSPPASARRGPAAASRASAATPAPNLAMASGRAREATVYKEVSASTSKAAASAGSVLSAAESAYVPLLSSGPAEVDANAAAATSATDGPSREASARDVTARELITREAPTRQALAREAATRESATREPAAREAATREATTREPRVVAASLPSAPATAAPAPAAVSPPMDRDFIARNQIIERYLSGRLPLKGATDFERFCRENPQLLDELGVPERVNAGLRLLEASGKPEPWQEPARPKWLRPQVLLGLGAAVVLLAVALGVVGSNSASKTQRIEKLQRQLAEQPLEAATNTRAVRLVPSREGASNTPAISISRSPAQLVDLRIDESRSPYKLFQITIDRIDQGRVAVLHNLAKDSNGHVRMALNSTALGPGNYQLTIQGLSWRGDPEPDSWITLAIQR
ncbi:MAG: hypothetical protein JOY91_12595 [Sinobacteraceae bacterium]|nr:hypothetical protein [Nevskiaceae bacterium]